MKLPSEQDDSSLKFAVSTTPKTINDIFGDSDSFAPKSSNNSNGFNTNNAFESNNNSTNTTTVKQVSHSKPGIDSIKMAIQSATTALEKSNNSGSIISDSKKGPEKASDDLFSLLDTSSSIAATTDTTVPVASILATNQTNPISPFATNSTPFDLPTNGHGNQYSAAMPSSNPFPSTATNSIFKSTGPDYTSLGPVEGFGDVLQPMSTGGRATTTQTSGKSSFASSGMPSTGLFKGDLDSTLANLAQNLTFEGLKPKK